MAISMNGSENGRKTNLIIIAILIVVVIGAVLWWRSSQPYETITSSGTTPEDTTQAIQGSIQSIDVGSVDKELQTVDNSIKTL